MFHSTSGQLPKPNPEQSEFLSLIHSFQHFPLLCVDPSKTVVIVEQTVAAHMVAIIPFFGHCNLDSKRCNSFQCFTKPVLSTCRKNDGICTQADQSETIEDINMTSIIFSLKATLESCLRASKSMKRRFGIILYLTRRFAKRPSADTGDDYTFPQVRSISKAPQENECCYLYTQIPLLLCFSSQGTLVLLTCSIQSSRLRRRLKQQIGGTS